MESSIKGGKNGLVADVELFDKENRLLTESITLTTSFFETEKGFGYNINTGLITLTSANKSACLYLKNNETEDIVVQNIFYILGNSTSGTGDLRCTILRNPTTGTIVDTATAGSINQNRNYGSNKTLDVDFYKGTEAATFTNGDATIDTILGSTPTRVPLTVGGIVLPKGSSIGVDITPQASNANMDLMVAMEVYKVTITL